jgi:cytoskeletal protein CcmA (bactofilin family)
MFNKNTPEAAKPNEAVSSSINLIGAGTTIEGDVKSNGDIRIDGTVIGTVTSKAKVVIGSTGNIEGDINCQNADISGTVKGKTNVSDMLFLKSSARITGDIISSKLVVESGASFTGSCNMGPVIKDIKSVDHKTTNNTVKEKTA